MKSTCLLTQRKRYKRCKRVQACNAYNDLQRHAQPPLRAPVVSTLYLPVMLHALYASRVHVYTRYEGVSIGEACPHSRCQSAIQLYSCIAMRARVCSWNMQPALRTSRPGGIYHSTQDRVGEVYGDIR